MKAIVYNQYGPSDVIRLTDVPKPVPQDNQVFVKIHSASVNPLDWRFMRADPFMVRFMGQGIFKPTKGRLGVDIAGTVKAVGKDVTQFKVGDEVFGGANVDGFAEYCTVVEKRIVHKPSSISFEDASTIPIAALTALQALRDSGKIQSTQKILINGASGGVGTFAVQIAKSFGTEVTGVCSGKNVELVKSIGADHVIDYTKEDFTKNNRKYDLIIDNAAYYSLSDYKRLLTDSGIYVLVGGAFSFFIKLSLFGSLYTLFSNKKLTGIMAQINQDDLNMIAQLMESDKVRPVIDRTYTLSETADALRYVEKGHARGKVIINIS